MRKTRLVVTVLLLTAIVFSAFGQGIEKYPNKPIRFIVPWAPGGLAPVMFEVLRPILTRELGVPVVMENIPGGGTAVGMKALQIAAPDGYTIGGESNSIFGATKMTKGDVDYRNFTPIVSLTEDFFAVTVHVDSPWKEFKQFYDYVKANPKRVRIGNSGAGATWHIAALAFNQAAGVELVPVPFSGGANAVTALLGKHIEATSVSTGDMTASLPTGKLRILALGAPQRDPFFPEIPTIKESIGLDISVGNWRGVLAPKGTPAERIKVLEAAFARAVKDPAYIAFMEKNKAANLFMNHEDFKKKYDADAEMIMSVLNSLEG